MYLNELWTEYADELRAWKRAEWEARREARREMGESAMVAQHEEFQTASDARMHEVLAGVRMLYGDGLCEVISKPWHDMQRTMRGVAADRDDYRLSNRRLQDRAQEDQALLEGFLDWVDARYVIRKQPVAKTK